MSAQVAAYPPREALVALVGGYRRIPVLQIGAHIYCDTRLAFAALTGNESDCLRLIDGDEALRQWAEQEVFFAVIAAASPYRAVRLLTRELGLAGLMRFTRDRIAMTRGATIVQPDGNTARAILSSFVSHCGTLTGASLPVRPGSRVFGSVLFSPTLDGLPDRFADQSHLAPRSS